MNKPILSLILYLIFFVGCNGPSSMKAPPAVTNGNLDLRSWDFETDGIVHLNGDWEFYWNQFIPPDGFEREDFSGQAGYTYVPNKWDNYEFNGKRVGGFGFATYRLKIDLHDTNQILALKLLSYSTAYQLWINGKLSASAGSIGKSKDEMVAEYLPQVITFQPNSNQLDIIVHMSNFHHRSGGLWTKIELGTEQQIFKKRNRTIAVDLFIMGSLLIMALYHFGLFYLRKSDPSPLFFGAICLLWSLNAFINGEVIFTEFFPQIDFAIFLRAEYLSTYLSIPLFALFLITLFPNEFHRRALYITALFFTIVTLIVLTAPVTIFTHVSIPTQIYMVVFGFYGLYVLISACRNQQTGAKWFVVGTVILMITAVNDVLHHNFIINTGNYRSIGLFFCILSQSLVLSSRFSEAFFKIEEISHELVEKHSALKSTTTALRDLNLSLETKVAERTEELASKHNQIKELLHVLCHDLSNPLYSIHSILKMEKESPEMFQQMIEYIELSVKNGIAIIDLIREMEAVEEGKIPFRIRPYNLLNLVKESQTIMSQALNRKKLTINVNCDKTYRVQVEKTSFVNSVLNNILSNATKYSFENSSIDINSTQLGPTIILRIKDYGIGMPEKILDKLFDFSKSTSRKGTNGEVGTGYGMPLMKKFVTMYGGRIEVTSRTGTGKSSETGTEVSLYLPASGPHIKELH